MSKSKVLLVVASEGFQHIEYNTPKKILTDAGFTVVTASNKKVPAIANDGSTTDVDVTLDNVNVADYDGIFFIGGPGAMEHLDNEKSYAVIRQAAQAKKPLGAICISARILAKAGVLKDRKATGWNGDNELEGIFKKYEVKYVPQDVVVDENIITATGPAAAKEFGQKIATLLK